MRDLPEAAGRRGADLLRGRVRTDEFRKASFDRVEALAQCVVFGVGNGRRVILVIALVVLFELEREPHVLDPGLRLGEVGDIAKRPCGGFCCSCHYTQGSSSSFRGGPKDQTRNLEIPGSHFVRPGMTVGGARGVLRLYSSKPTRWSNLRRRHKRSKRAWKIQPIEKDNPSWNDLY